ncbi:hypothetical protein AAGG74_19065 [Bacillus mexicanus]|uniref:hypothetical protein n=1 Tax=Bacillus mexicanus TaxID=2834415 RepID=UPI003D2261D9
MNNYNSIHFLEESKKIIDESIELIKENTIDSLLRYFQTGKIKDNIHLPTLLIEDDFIIEKLLAQKIKPIINELGFELNENDLNEKGKLILDYVKEDLVLSFATINLNDRVLEFHFDFVEMEREREVKLENLKRKIASTQQKYMDIKAYLKREKKGVKKIKYGDIFDRLEETISKIKDDITVIEKEIYEINNQKTLLEDIKNALPDIEYQFRKYGFLIEFVKGEEYEI